MEIPYPQNQQYVEPQNYSANRMTKLKKYALIAWIASGVLGVLFCAIPDNEAYLDYSGLTVMSFLVFVISIIVYFISGRYIDCYDVEHTTATLNDAAIRFQNGALSIEQYNQIKYSSIIQTRKIPPQSILISAIVGIVLSGFSLLASCISPEKKYSNIVPWFLDLLSCTLTLVLMIYLYNYANKHVDSIKRKELLNNLINLRQLNYIDDHDLHKLEEMF